jgi:hypothetical protein
LVGLKAGLLMAIDWQAKAPEITEAAGLLPPKLCPRPEFDRAGKSHGIIQKNHLTAAVRGIMALSRRAWLAQN